MNYRLIEVAQDTEEWLAWRRSGITATEASIIVGANPYETKEELFLVKSGQKSAEFKNNEAIQRGKDLEPVVREKINNHYQENFQPACVQSVKDPYMIASLDGLSADGSLILEIKCPTNFGSHKKNYSFYQGYCQDDYEWELHGMPKYYLTQVLWQLACVKAESALFVSYLQGNYKVAEVSINNTYYHYLLDRMKTECLQFWEDVQAARLTHEN
jgi:putative phage-type endonuclease